MGTNYTGEANCGGIIPQVMETIFKKADALKDGTEFLIRVSFIEVSYMVASIVVLPVPTAISFIRDNIFEIFCVHSRSSRRKSLIC